MVLSFVHLVLYHSFAYTVFCLHGCFSKVSKNRVSRGPPVLYLFISAVFLSGWYFNQFDSMMVYMIEQGVPKEKIVLGTPLYGRGFVLNNTEENGLYCGAHAGIPAGPYTRQDGIWGYQEIIQAFTNDTLINLPEGKPKDWTVVVDDCYQAPYAYNGPYWIGYDNEESMAVKAKFINFLDIAGAMVWSIDTDDFKGGNTHAYPLLHVS